jgi:hypothetical protein
MAGKKTKYDTNKAMKEAKEKGLLKNKKKPTEVESVKK